MEHRPFSELTKHFTAEDWAYVNEGVEKIREEVEEEKAKRAGREGAWRVTRKAAMRPPAKGR